MDTANVGSIAISKLGMGCWAYGGGAYWGAQAQEDVNAVVAMALDEGINFFDTAEAYNDGESEISLGRALSGKRLRAVIASKVSPDHARPADLRASCEASLKRLGTDYIDLYMMHWPINVRAIAHFSDKGTVPVSAQEAFGEMLRLKEEGKIREIGVSNFGVTQMKQLLDIGIPVAVNELPFNLLCRAIEKDILPFCIENGIAVLGYMALMQGLLADIYSTVDEVPPYQAHSRHFAQETGKGTSRHNEAGCEEILFKAIGQMRVLCKEEGLSLPRTALAWAMARKGITSTLVGSRNTRELQENIFTASRVSLSHDLVSKLDEISKPVWDALGDSPDYYENRAESRVY